MTDILTKLAALTSKDENALLPCPVCDAPCDTLTAHGFGNYSVQCFNCGLNTGQKSGKNAAITAWNARPREAALIALVQEAAAEIEWLRAALQAYAEADYDGTGFWDGISLPGILADKGKTAKQALNPQESAP
jgi:hypothetical protein